MPPPSEAQSRYDIIDRCLTNMYNRYPTMEDLLRTIVKELKTKVSRETIQKDIAKMKQPLSKGGFGAPIKFKKAYNGYYYDLEKFPNYTIRQFGLSEKSLEQIELAAGVLQRFKGIMSSDSFNQTLNHLYASLNIERSQNEKNLANAILPEDTTYLRGMENFDILVDGIKRQLPISFVHYSYQSQLFKPTIIHPYLLKESNDRWYLVGYSEEHKEIRYFGLDRIYEPVLLNHTYRPNKSADLKALFANKIGLNTLRGNDEYQTEKIRIWVSKDLANYFKSMPIHATQQNKEEDGRGAILVDLELVPTYELLSLIMSYGNKVMVMQPLWLRKVIEKELEQSLSAYKRMKKNGSA